MLNDSKVMLKRKGYVHRAKIKYGTDPEHSLKTIMSWVADSPWRTREKNGHQSGKWIGLVFPSRQEERMWTQFIFSR